MLSGALALAGLAGPACAIPSDAGGNPYQRVVERNVFDLKPLIPPPETNVAPVIPPAKVSIQGITDMLGKKQVLLKILETPTKPGQPPQERALIMDEGERRGIVTVLEINPKARTVKFDNGGLVQTLELTNAPVKVAGPIPVTPTAAVPMPVIPVMPRPNMPGAPGVPPPTTGFPTPTMPTMPAAPGTTTTPNIPSRPVRTAAVPQLTHEEQIVMMELQREQTKEAVAAGKLPPLPPTPLTPAGAAGLTPPPAPPSP